MSIPTQELDAGHGITIHSSRYSNCLMLFASQVNKIGTIVQVTADNPEEAPEHRVYTVETLFGDRDEWNEVLARGIVEVLPEPRLYLCVSLRDKTIDVFKSVVQTLAQHSP